MADQEIMLYRRDPNIPEELIDLSNGLYPTGWCLRWSCRFFEYDWEVWQYEVTGECPYQDLVVIDRAARQEQWLGEVLSKLKPLWDDLDVYPFIAAMVPVVTGRFHSPYYELKTDLLPEPVIESGYAVELEPMNRGILHLYWSPSDPDLSIGKREWYYVADLSVSRSLIFHADLEGHSPAQQILARKFTNLYGPSDRGPLGMALYGEEPKDI